LSGFYMGRSNLGDAASLDLYVYNKPRDIPRRIRRALKIYLLIFVAINF
jgi:hypothetical protein